MKLKSFEDLFNILVADCFIIEEQGLDLMSKMIQKAYSSELREALEKHQNKEKQQKQGIKHLMQEAGMTIQEVEWESPIKSVFKSASKFLDENDSSPLLDAAIITLAQQIKHLEIVHYGTLEEFATITERHELKELLRSTLKEEKEADSLLIRLGRESGLNVEAAKAKA
ncbi:MAG: DUF892 family protein [Chlamydiales bacterium]|nr:DUF892 family protein [Chlamydiales bacterium]